MSKWGLEYVGVQAVFPEDWNKIVDALNELDGRSFAGHDGGKIAFDGDDNGKDFIIPHGLNAIPTVVFVGAGSVDAMGDMWYEASSIQITVHYDKAPKLGIANVFLWWYVLKI